jgi:hypothetical protein
LNDEIEGKKIKKRIKKSESAQFNIQNPWLRSWDWYNLIESKPKQIMKLNSQSTQILNGKIEKNQLQKRTQKHLSQLG